MQIIRWLFNSNPEAERVRAATNALGATIEEINDGLRRATGLIPAASSQVVALLPLAGEMRPEEAADASEPASAAPKKGRAAK